MRRQPGKPIAWLKSEVKTPPFSQSARLEAGLLLRRLQRGEVLGMPQSRPMPAIGPHCHELRIPDREHTWRIVYHVADDAIAILDVFSKKTQSTQVQVIELCRKRLAAFMKSATQ
jgi:phage-related protein